MQIVRLIKKKKTADLTVDENTYENVAMATVVRYNIKEGDYLDQNTLNEIILDSDKTRALEYLLGLLSRGAKTEYEARQKLVSKGFRRLAIEYAVGRCKELGYISDERFAENYLSLNSGYKGEYRIKRELKQKGVPEEILSKSVIEPGDEREAAKYVAEKYLRNKEYDKKTAEKLLRHLASRGFSYDTIKTVLSDGNFEVDCNLTLSD